MVFTLGIAGRWCHHPEQKEKKNPWSYASVCDGSQHHGSNRFNLGLRIGLLASNWKSCYLFIILFDFIYFSIRDCWVKYTAKKQPGRALGGVIQTARQRNKEAELKTIILSNKNRH